MRHLSSFFQYMHRPTGTVYQSNPDRHGRPQAASFRTTMQENSDTPDLSHATGT